MLRINNIKMELNLKTVGFIRMGKIECPVCGELHMPDIVREIHRKEADPLYEPEGRGQVCDCCGAILVAQEMALI